jgi:competence protein ComEC
MRKSIMFLLAMTLSAVSLAAQSRNAKTLDIYVIDVEGGNSQLWVSPSGESVLIDSGNGGTAATRDADRIMAAVHDAGLKQIDHLITTHYHGDHFGGLSEFATRIPIKEFIDHGANVQASPQTDADLKHYAELYAETKHTIPKPGDKISVSGLDWRVMSSATQILKTPLPGAGAPNPYCADFQRHDTNPVSGVGSASNPYGHTEDDQVVASHVTFGKFRALYLGDIDWNQEPELMCPINRVGTVDLFVVSRHGQPSSNSEVLVHAIRSRAIITNNGLLKGGQPSVMKILLTSPRLEDLWQIHFAYLGGQEYTVPGMFIANHSDVEETTLPVGPMPRPPSPVPLELQHNGPAYWIKVSAQMDGSFTVTNSRNGFSKTYKAGN